MNEKQHFIFLDGMRGMAAIIVLVFHICQHHEVAAPRFAQLAVDFFFLLSGFVVAYAYEQRLLNGMGIRRFIAVRLIRLYPMILVGMTMGLAITAARILIVHDITWLQFLSVAVSSLLVLPSFALPQYLTAYPANMAMWSLTFEILANIVYVLVIRKLSDGILIATILLSAVAMVVINYFEGTMLFGGAKYLFIGGLPRIGFSFSAGILLFRHWKPARHSWGNAAAYGIAVPFCAVLLIISDVSGWADILLILFVLPLVLWAASAVKPQGITAAACVWLGELSYPLYAIHDPILRAFRTIRLKSAFVQNHAIGFLIAEVLLSVAIALLMLKFYDKPVRKWLSGKIARGRMGQPARQGP